MTAPGELLGGRYRVGRLLGEGTTKRVHLARDELLGRDVAVCTPQAPEQEHARSLRQEAALLARVGDSPHLVGVHDIGVRDGLPWVVLQHLPGGSLRALLDHGPPPVERALELATGLALALVDLHAAGLVHRDLSPDNAWLGADGRPVLGDLGLAAPVGAPTDSLEGTPAYLPPEQVLGGRAEPVSDLYGLGALLYELLTGRPPFHRPTAVPALEAHLHTRPVPPSRHRSGLPPGTDDLVLALLAKDPAERPRTAAEVADRLEQLHALARAAVPPAPGPRSSWRFVGREQELALLHEAVEGAENGRGGLVLLLGEPGIGKTRTTDEVAAHVRQRPGGRVWRGRCPDGEGVPPYWPWSQVLREAAGEDADRLRAQAGADAPLLAALLPELAPAGVSGVPDGDGVRFRLFDAVSRLLTALAADGPALVVLDDLHWADLPTLRLTRHVADEARRTRLLLVVCARELAVPDAGLTRELGRLAQAATQTLELDGLARDPSGRLVEQLTGAAPDPRLLQDLHEQTGGNPFFLAELVRLLVAEGRLDGPLPSGSHVPTGVREVLHRRLERLSPGTVEVLRSAAVVGRDVPLDLLAQVTGLPRPALLAALDEAAEARLLLPLPTRPGVSRFVHALVQEVLHEDLPTARRAALHGDVAAGLLAGRDAVDDEQAAELARHFVQAAVDADPRPAVVWSARAGREAASRTGHEEAVGHFARALALREALPPDEPGLPGRGELLLALGDAQVRAGQPDEGRSTFARAASLALTEGDPELLARAALGAGLGLGGFGFVEHADGELLSLLEEALAGLPDDSPLRLRVLARLATELYFTPFERRRKQVSQEALELSRRLGDRPGELVALYSHTWALLGPDGAEERRATAHRVVQLATELGDTDMVFRGHHLRLHALLELGEREHAQTEVEQLRALAAASRDPVQRWQVAVLDAARVLFEGRVEEAEQRAAEALALGRHSHADMAAVSYGAQLLTIRYAQDRLGEVVEAARTFADRYPHAPAWRAALAFCLLCDGQPDAARGELDRLAVRDFADLPRDGNHLTVTTLLAHVAAGLGDVPRARRLHELLLPFAGRPVVIAAGAVLFAGVDLALGALATTLGDPDAALRWLESAERQHAGAGSWQAWTAQEQVRALLARGGPGDLEQAQQRAEDAAARAEALGLPRQADRLRRLVAGAGQGPVTVLLTDVAGSTALTERLGELAVHRLLAQHRADAAQRAREHGGRALKSLGDGVLLAFDDVERALACAVQLQASAQENGLPLRLAVHSGAVLREGASLYGRTMVVAFRLSDRARAGEVLVSGEARDAVSSVSGLRFDAARRLRLKGLAGQQRVHRLLWQPVYNERTSASTASKALRAAMRTGSQTGLKGGA